MGRSQETFGKKDREKKKQKKREEKARRKAERKQNSGGDVFMYVDDDGNLTPVPPDPNRKKKEIDVESIAVSVPRQEAIEMDPIRYGVVQFFNPNKGFGFIRDKENGEEYFVHVNGLIDRIQEQDRVVFELEPGMKGLNAVRVKLDR